MVERWWDVLLCEKPFDPDEFIGKLAKLVARLKPLTY